MSEWVRWKSIPDKYWPSILSPIPEHEEPPPSLASPPPHRFSPLPELIIEKEISDMQVGRHDSNELGQEYDNGNCENNGNSTRNVETENVSLDEEEGADEATNAEVVYEDDAETMQLAESADSRLESENVSGGEISQSYTESDSDSYARLAEDEGERHEESEKSVGTQAEDVEEEQTHALSEKLSEEGERSNTQENSSDSFPVAVVETVEAMVHAEKEMEVIRKDRVPLRDISLEGNRISSPKEQRSLHANTGFLSMEYVTFSSTNYDTTPMELDSVPFSPIFRTSLPEFQSSPILRKRPSISVDVGGKRQKSNDVVQTSNVVGAESSETRSKKDFGMQCTPGLNNVSSQTDNDAFSKEVGMQTDPNAEDYSKEIVALRNINKKNIGTQTDSPDYTDRTTQTSDRYLEYMRFTGGNEIYFFF